MAHDTKVEFTLDPADPTRLLTFRNYDCEIIRKDDGQFVITKKLLEGKFQGLTVHPDVVEGILFCYAIHEDNMDEHFYSLSAFKDEEPEIQTELLNKSKLHEDAHSKYLELFLKIFPGVQVDEMYTKYISLYNHLFCAEK